MANHYRGRQLTIRNPGVRVGVTIGCLIGMTVSQTPLLFSPFAIMLLPVSAQFGWGRGVMPAAQLAAAPVLTLLYPVVGRLLDLFGSRRVLVAGYLLSGLSVGALSQLNGSVTQLMVLYLAASVFTTLLAGIAFARVIAQIFQENRGIVLGLCLGVGGGIGAALMPPFTNFLLTHWGWRGGYVGIGLAPILVGLPAVLFLIPRTTTLSSGRATAPASGLSAAVAMRKPELSLLLGATLFSGIAIAGVNLHMAAIATDRGLSGAASAAMVSVVATSMMAGQLTAGFFLDRIATPRVAVPLFSAILVGIMLVHVSATTPRLLVLGAMLDGFGAGSEYGLLPYFVTRFFGLRSFGLLYGAIYGASAIATGLGPYIMGRTFDLTGSYGSALFGFEAAMVATLVMLIYLPRYVYAPDGSPLAAGAGETRAARMAEV